MKETYTASLKNCTREFSIITELFGEYDNGVPLCGFGRLSNSIEFSLRSKIINNSEYELLNADDNKIKKPSTLPLKPFLIAKYNEDTADLRITNISKGSINKGQKFAARTISQIFVKVPAMKSIHYDLITNKYTKEIIITVRDSPDCCRKMKELYSQSALLGALVSNGFRNIHIMKTGYEDFSVRAFRAEKMDCIFEK